MRKENIFPSTEIKSQNPMDNKRNRNQKKYFNKSNISKTLQNPKNIFDFLFKIEENTILSNFNKSTAVSFNNINLINNSGFNKNLLRNQLKYIQMTSDYIDNKIKSNMNYPYNGSEYQYMKIVNNMLDIKKNIPYNQKYPYPIDNYTFIYNNKIISNPSRITNNNTKQSSPRNVQNQEKLDLSSFCTTIGGNIPYSSSNSNKININSNNNHNMNNIENGIKGPKQLKTFKIGKKEDFIISSMNGDIISTESKNNEKIIFDITKRAESPTSIRTFNTGSSNSLSTGTNSMPSNKVIVEYNNRIKKNNNIKKSPPKNIDKSPTFSKVMIENSKTPQNNNRKRKNKLAIKIDENKNNINYNNNIIKNARNNMVSNNINNKLNIYTNITPRNKAVKKIKISMDETTVKQRSKSPIQINYHQKDNSFISPFRNKEYSTLSEDERDLPQKHNKINYSIIDMDKSRNRNEYININNINSYITQILKKKKKIIKLNPYNNNNSEININNNRCITNENKKDISREYANQIRKSPTSIKIKPKIIIKKEINEKNLPKNYSNRIKTKIVQKKNIDKEKAINNSYLKNVNNANNLNNANKIYNKENYYSNKIINNQILNNNLKNEDVKNQKELLNLSNLKNNNNLNIIKERNIKNDNISGAENKEKKEVQIKTEKKENKENNNVTNNNIKNNTKKKKKPKKKIFNIDLTEENTDNKNNIIDDNNHSEDISDKSLSEDNKPQIYDFDKIYEKREMEPTNFDNRQNLSKNFFCSFGQKNYKEENDNNINNKNEIKKEYNEPISIELKLLNELKEKIKERNDKKLDNFSNNNINNNKERTYKSNELQRIIKSYANNNNDINKKSLIKPNSNPNYQFNKKEENLSSESEENNINKIDDYKKEIKDKQFLSNNYKNLDDKKFYKTNETGSFGKISNEKIEQYNNNNFDSQSFGEKESNINQSSENKISNYTKDEYDNSNNKGKEDQFKLSFKINSDLCESEFDDIKYL